MDGIKEAFQRVKTDMDSLRQEIILLKASLEDVKQEISQINQLIHLNLVNKNPEIVPTDNLEKQTIPTHSSTDKYALEGLKSQNLDISTGNEGVPTDKQTNKQTNKQEEITPKIGENNSIEEVIKILDSLDSIKKDIRLKFKRLTTQEFLVFSSLYQLEEDEGYADYKSLSRKLNLSESSIRDYIGRLIKKGIPVDKIRINNKYIQLSISSKLKKIVTLPTILQLREI